MLDYLLHSGSENVILYCEDNLYVIKTLREFQYVDDYGRDQGANVRQKAKDITNLLLDRRRLFQERTARARMRDRMLGRPSIDTDEDDEDDDGLAQYRRPRAQNANGVDRQRQGQHEEEENLRKAIEESKKSANALATAEERDVQRAIELSKEEEERRKRLVALAERGVFDDTDFYQQLLRDIIESRGAGLNGEEAEPEWIRRQKAHKAKRKKTVDVKASKGRKLRYQVHEKLQNFMVPIAVAKGAWHDEQIDELFASLLGSAPLCSVS